MIDEVGGRIVDDVVGVAVELQTDVAILALIVAVLLLLLLVSLVHDGDAVSFERFEDGRQSRRQRVNLVLDLTLPARRILDLFEVVFLV